MQIPQLNDRRLAPAITMHTLDNRMLGSHAAQWCLQKCGVRCGRSCSAGASSMRAPTQDAMETHAGAQAGGGPCPILAGASVAARKLACPTQEPLRSACAPLPLTGGRGGHAGRVGQAQGGHARAGLHQEAVRMPVVAPHELEHLRAGAHERGRQPLCACASAGQCCTAQQRARPKALLCGARRSMVERVQHGRARAASICTSARASPP